MRNPSLWESTQKLWRLARRCGSKLIEEGTIDAEESEEDERSDVEDTFIAPMADILNARNGCDDVCPYLFPLTSTQVRPFY